MYLIFFTNRKIDKPSCLRLNTQNNKKSFQINYSLFFDMLLILSSLDRHSSVCSSTFPSLFGDSFMFLCDKTLKCSTISEFAATLSIWKFSSWEETNSDWLKRHNRQEGKSLMNIHDMTLNDF